MIKRLPLPSVILLLLSGLLVAASVLLLNPPLLVAADPSADVYFHTHGGSGRSLGADGE
jgi:cytochrome d ubiquinol oxidase subunit I